MIVNKKFDRLRQWGRERMGGEVRTDTNDEFKSLEIEMQLRGEGMERLNRSAKEYIKHISRRDAGEAKEKQLPVGYFGNAMMTHGEDFEPDSEFGQCLSTLGRANERIARIQETYCANATSSWLESIERSLVQMKEFNEARRKLDNRRLAYDTATAKMQKSKKEDFRMEEELRSQKAKYEESSEDVYRRMMDIKDAESETVADLTSFLEAELTYYDRCRELLLQVKRDWPASGATSDRSRTSSPANGYLRRNTVNRSRNNSLAQRFDDIAEDEPLEPPHRPGIRSRAPSGTSSPRRELPGFDIPSRPPINGRANSTFEGPTSLGSVGRSESPASSTTMPRLTRVPTEPTPILTGKASLRSTSKPPPPREPTTTTTAATTSNIFSDDQSSETSSSDTASFLHQHHQQSDPARSASWSQNGFLSAAVAGNGSHDVFGAKKTPPPPPPPSRAKKPPPPPPMKRSALSTGEVPRC
ncbi:hypothetical protein D0864_15365 [Hortaea werneckii]|uniref:BAR domain-containing protein n=1 Tax=Hortaea werneckii TaxID=91943 RepID=A0A3M7C2F3_HORWE|nr:BAR-domain-containing protein [Hortaea werneckii]KAI6857886.1 BAR-domain-containing protein [Hortaea werneckii]KAI7347821.1 BAR-domain-containing protein [Hortaea werneckii]RMY45827.1 hypothetical protein D0864_15365 [Hortaea werneckii]RMY66494.1 hypothetical protein D0862_15189 [Hortaea werneckii]